MCIYGTVFLTLIFVTFSLTAQENPCQDPQYLALKKKPLDSMSQREYEYFSLRDKACVEKYSGSNLKAKDQKSMLVIEVGEFTGTSSNKFSPEIYVDDNRYGTSPQTVTLDAGEHTISLVPAAQIEFEKQKVRTSSNRMTQLNSMVIKRKFEGARKYGIQYTFRCRSPECNADNEWWYSANVEDITDAR